MTDNTAEQLRAIELDETALNDAGWAFVEAMPHVLPGPIWNELKPALRVAIAKYLNGTRADSGEAVAWLHTMHMELGQTARLLNESSTHPWGTRGKHYDESYTVTSEPLFTHPRATAVDVRDAERYRYLRKSAVAEWRNGPGLYWHLPRHMLGNSEEKLDQHVDSQLAAIASREDK